MTFITIALGPRDQGYIFQLSPLKVRALRQSVILVLVVSLYALKGYARTDETLKTLIFLPEEQEIELALSAAPEHLRSEATVYVFRKTGYEKTRSGKNGFICMVNRDGNQRGDNDLKPTCWDPEGGATIVPVMLRVGQLLAQGRTADEIKQDIDAGFSDGRFSSPRKTGIAYMLRGDVLYDPTTKGISKTSFPPHYMIYAPGVTNADIGMNVEAYKRHPSLPLVYEGYSGGPRTAYIILVATEHKRSAH